MIAREPKTYTSFQIEAGFLDSDTVMRLVKYLRGEISSTPTWLDDLNNIQLLDLAVLAGHLEISCLQFITTSRLCTLVIDEGIYPNREMMIHLSVISKKTDAIRHLFQDSVFLNMTLSPSLTEKFRNRSRVTNEELADGMWLSDLRETINHLVKTEKVKEGDAFAHARTIWISRSVGERTNDNPRHIQDLKALEVIFTGLSHAISSGALRDSDFYCFFDDADDMSSKFHHLKQRRYLRSSIQLPLIRFKSSELMEASLGPGKRNIRETPSADVATSISATAETAPPSTTSSLPSKRKAPSHTIQLPAKSQRLSSESDSKSHESATTAHVNATVKEPQSTLVPGDVILLKMSPSSPPSKRSLRLDCADSACGPFVYLYVVRKCPRLWVLLEYRHSVTVVNVKDVNASSMVKYLGFANNVEGEQFDFSKWDLKTKLRVIDSAIRMQAAPNVEHMIQRLHEDFKTIVMTLAIAEWIYGNAKNDSPLEKFAALALHYVFTRNDVDVATKYHYVVTNASGHWSIRARKALMDDLESVQNKYGGKEKLEEHPYKGFAYAVNETRATGKREKFQGAF